MQHEPPAPDLDLFFFRQVIARLGPTRAGRARDLGVSRRSLKRIESDDLPHYYRRLLDHPILLAALLLDALIYHSLRRDPDPPPAP